MDDINLNGFYYRNNDYKFYNIQRSYNLFIHARYVKNYDNALLYFLCYIIISSNTNETAYFRSKTPVNVINHIVQLSAD
jgi:uncharacterized protein with PQ loop repeat